MPTWWTHLLPFLEVHIGHSLIHIIIFRPRITRFTYEATMGHALDSGDLTIGAPLLIWSTSPPTTTYRRIPSAIGSHLTHELRRSPQVDHSQVRTSIPRKACSSDNLAGGCHTKRRLGHFLSIFNREIHYLREIRLPSVDPGTYGRHGAASVPSCLAWRKVKAPQYRFP